MNIARLGVKATTLKAKAKDLASKAKAKAKDLAFEAKAKDPWPWPSRPRPRLRTMSRPMSIWFAVQSKLQNTDVYCRAGND